MRRDRGKGRRMEDKGGEGIEEKGSRRRDRGEGRRSRRMEEKGEKG